MGDYTTAVLEGWCADNGIMRVGCKGDSDNERFKLGFHHNSLIMTCFFSRCVVVSVITMSLDRPVFKYPSIGRMCFAVCVPRGRYAGVVGDFNQC